MKAARRKFDSYSMQSATDHGIAYAENSAAACLEYLTDSRKKERREKGECRYCYYFRRMRIGGQAMTEWESGICAAPDMHANTAVPRLCNACGKKHELCVECAGDLHQRIRRKLEGIEVTP